MPSIPTPGVYTPSPTFFKKDSSAAKPQVDVETQVKHTVFLAENGITGAVLLGSTGEMIHLTRQERIDFVAGVKKGLVAAGHGSFPILAGVAQNGIEDTLEDIEGLKEAGAEYAMVLAPNYFAPSTSQQGVVDWFYEVADHSALPVVIYYFPGVSNNLKVTPATFEKLSAHENIVGCKLSHGNVSDYTQIALNPKVKANNFSTMTGLGQLLLPAIAVGVDGTIDAISGVFPKTLVKLYKLAKEGKIAEAQKIQYVVSRVEEVVVAYGPIGVKHAFNKIHGYGNEAGRAPINITLTAAQKDEFAAVIAEAAALENSL